jgi:hypothetical protein
MLLCLAFPADHEKGKHATYMPPTPSSRPNCRTIFRRTLNSAGGVFIVIGCIPLYGRVPVVTSFRTMSKSANKFNSRLLASPKFLAAICQIHAPLAE